MKMNPSELPASLYVYEYQVDLSSYRNLPLVAVILSRPIISTATMPPSPYLLHVNSRPTAVDDNLWTKWYTSEHIPDIIQSKACARATFYKEIPAATTLDNTADANPRNFLALYQTQYADLLNTDANQMPNVRQGSELFERASGQASSFANGEFDGRNYKLIQDFDPNGLGDGKAFHSIPFSGKSLSAFFSCTFPLQ